MELTVQRGAMNRLDKEENCHHPVQSACCDSEGLGDGCDSEGLGTAVIVRDWGIEEGPLDP